MKYLTKGIEYTRLKSEDRTDKIIKYGMYAIAVVYTAYLTVVLFIIFWHFPVFRPTVT